MGRKTPPTAELAVAEPWPWPPLGQPAVAMFASIIAAIFAGDPGHPLSRVPIFLNIFDGWLGGMHSVQTVVRSNVIALHFGCSRWVASAGRLITPVFAGIISCPSLARYLR